MCKITSYSQLNKKERSQIEILLRTEKSKTEIARLLNRSPSTIYRELKRNVPKRGKGAGEYNAQRSIIKTELRHKSKPKAQRFTPEMQQKIRHQLEHEKLSPELISGRARVEGQVFVSHETIYKWIWRMKQSHCREDRQDRHLYRFLLHGRRKRKRGNSHDNRGIIPNRISIEQRPLIVEKRKRLGDLEADLIIGQNHKSALLAITERASLYTLLEKVNGKNAQALALKMKNTLLPLRSLLKSLTLDNDKAFSMHEIISKQLQVPVYFTHPYSAHEKGIIENRIGVIRRFFPKKTNFAILNRKQVQQVQNKINTRPIKKFNFNTPAEIFITKLSSQFFALIS